MENNVLGEQAHFSTTLQSFRSTSDPKNETCGILKYVYYLFKKYLFRVRHARLLLLKWQNSFYSVTEVNYDQARNRRLGHQEGRRVF